MIKKLALFPHAIEIRYACQAFVVGLYAFSNFYLSLLLLYCIPIISSYLLKKILSIPANLPLLSKSASVGVSERKIQGQKQTLML